MTTITTRSGKGSPLTHAELDANLTNLNADKLEPDANGRISAAGLIFPATPVPSTNVNTLDYYVEGTFTPVLAGTTTAGSGTYSGQTGRYTRIGNVVHIWVRLIWTAHTGTGPMIITGLPFQAASSISVHLLTVGSNNITYSGASLFAYVGSGASSITLSSGGSATASAVVGMDTAGDIYLAGTYQAA